MKKNYARCAFCGIPSEERICNTREGRNPPFCPTQNKKNVIEKSLKELKRPEIREYTRKASIQEAECYANRGKKGFVIHPIKPRLQEIIEFAWKMNFKRLGLAFCEGLKDEAAITARILEKQGFEVVSVMCKVGGVPKEEIGIEEHEKILIGEEETMCNPIAQAEICNDAETDLNIMLGLCVGHDSLFIKYSRAYTTIFAVKDRVLAHNPLGVVYNIRSYYARFLEKKL